MNLIVKLPDAVTFAGRTRSKGSLRLGATGAAGAIRPFYRARARSKVWSSVCTPWLPTASMIEL